MRAHLRGFHDAHHGEEDEGQQGSDGQGQSLEAPVECHEDDDIGTVGFLWVREVSEAVREMDLSHPENPSHFKQCWEEPKVLF